MPLKIDRKLENDVTILNLSGDIIAGEESQTLKKTFKDLIAGGSRKLLLNLEAIDHLDTSGLGALVSANGYMFNQQGTIKLLGLTDRVRTLLKITRLITIFDVFDDQEEAIRSFS